MNCPECNTIMTKSIERVSIQYGHAPAVMLSFLAPIYTCSCNSQVTANGYEEAEKKAINDYLGR